MEPFTNVWLLANKINPMKVIVNITFNKDECDRVEVINVLQ
tara:strand:+ start:106 stop:228 length:123 start_codon:yes stop_codon:yes gene_type:complete